MQRYQQGGVFASRLMNVGDSVNGLVSARNYMN